MDVAVLVSKQAGKKVFTGTLTASLAVSELRKGTMAVNPEAQRSLAKGVGKDSTMELLVSDKVHNTPRMKSFVKFIDRVMDQNSNTEGFLGAVQVVVPEEFREATFEALEVDADERRKNATLSTFIKALDGSQAGTLTLRPRHGQAGLHIVDGQGRIFGLHSFERSVEVQLEKVRREVKKLQKAALTSNDPATAQRHLEEQQENERKLRERLERISEFLSETRVSFVCYVEDILEDGQVVGLPVQAEKRLYIEGNALNAQASKEDVLRYEGFSPVIVDLEEYRTTQEWLSDDFIEDESKSIGSNSTRLFTLSSLAQAYSYAYINKPNALRDVDETMFDIVAKRQAFVHAYWDRINELFGGVWIPYSETPSDRLKYVREQRGRQNVLFQAIFLIALGRLGYALGTHANWDPASPVLKKLTALDPEAVSYYAQNPMFKGGYDRTWTETMMKPSRNADTGKMDRFAFNNVNDTISNTYKLLASKVGIDPVDDDEDTQTAQPQNDPDGILAVVASD
ncbi:DNA sulfur modification protein DndB [Deinococcus aerophilus]|uniref:Abortive phage infection protein n=1 Tax=Deinococcus aerophilus TaxID=522488 RepID=A0ABQ2H1D0_9DEIO|nr:DNA sulfur modification protein DndB [Deinococcus aerophilus]GGM21911.1 hypothetical protein GCM10010841_32230 [Deinococcus aerophilus]